MKTEIAYLRRDEIASRLRQDYLPAVAGGGDARCPVHVDPDVALLGHVRRAGMDADPHPDRARGEYLQRLGGCLERTRSRREGDEKSVALGVDLDPSVGAEGLRRTRRCSASASA